MVKEIDSILAGRNHYQVLGLPAASTSVRTIKRAYFELALKVQRLWRHPGPSFRMLATAGQVHPDKCSHPSSSEAFKRLSAAAEALGDESNQVPLP
jgi:curved DNA-binding protein CbpA